MAEKKKSRFSIGKEFVYEEVEGVLEGFSCQVMTNISMNKGKWENFNHVWDKFSAKYEKEAKEALELDGFFMFCCGDSDYSNQNIIINNSQNNNIELIDNGFVLDTVSTCGGESSPVNAQKTFSTIGTQTESETPVFEIINEVISEDFKMTYPKEDGNKKFIKIFEEVSPKLEHVKMTHPKEDGSKKFIKIFDKLKTRRKITDLGTEIKSSQIIKDMKELPSEFLKKKSEFMRKTDRKAKIPSPYFSPINVFEFESFKLRNGKNKVNQKLFDIQLALANVIQFQINNEPERIEPVQSINEIVFSFLQTEKPRYCQNCVMVMN